MRQLAAVSTGGGEGVGAGVRGMRVGSGVRGCGGAGVRGCGGENRHGSSWQTHSLQQ